MGALGDAAAAGGAAVSVVVSVSEDVGSEMDLSEKRCFSLEATRACSSGKVTFSGLMLRELSCGHVLVSCLDEVACFLHG